jgi:LuxR family maltose regulon positive regulatory protein
LLEPGQMIISRVPPQRVNTGQAAPMIVEPLSEREREVLRLLSGMLTTAEIGTEMYISVNTVKTHLRSIYRKLSAAHRGEAVRRARELQLI